MKRIVFIVLALLLIAVNVEAAGSIIKKWAGETTAASTDAYGGGTADLLADEAWDYSGTFSNVDLETSGYEGCVVYLQHDSAGSTDYIIMGIFTSVDGSDWSDFTIYEQAGNINGGADTTEPGIVVRDLQHFRIGVKTSDTTDAFDYQIKYDCWNWYYN